MIASVRAYFSNSSGWSRRNRSIRSFEYPSGRLTFGSPSRLPIVSTDVPVGLSIMVSTTMALHLTGPSDDARRSWSGISVVAYDFRTAPMRRLKKPKSANVVRSALVKCPAMTNLRGT